jgi:putative glycosyltransferase (TIGR04372 family)
LKKKIISENSFVIKWKKFFSYHGLNIAWILPLFLFGVSIIQFIGLLKGKRIKIVAIPSRFGHLALEPDLFLARNGGHLPSNQITLALYPQNPSSPALLEEWKKIFGKAPQAILRSLYQIEISTGKKWFIDNLVIETIPSEIQRLDFRPRHVFERIEECNLNTQDISLLQNAGKIILLSVRDNHYDRKLETMTRGGHALFRNSDIQDYSSAIETVISRGYTVVRIGKAGQPLNNPPSSNYLDLCQIEESVSDKLQYYFASMCQALISNDTGAINIGMLFRKPIYCLNFASLANGFRSHHLKFLMLKRMKDSISNKNLSLHELFLRGFQDFTHELHFIDKNIDWYDNSQQDILNYMIEVVEHLEGRWSPSTESLAIKDELISLSKRYSIPSPTIDIPNYWAMRSQYLLG